MRTLYQLAWLIIPFVALTVLLFDLGDPDSLDRAALALVFLISMHAQMVLYLDNERRKEKEDS